MHSVREPDLLEYCSTLDTMYGLTPPRTELVMLRCLPIGCLCLLTLALVGCGGGDAKERAEPATPSAFLDVPEPIRMCEGCILPEGLPSLRDTQVVELGTDEVACAGVCIQKGSSGNGVCIMPEEMDMSCNYKAGGYDPEEVDPMLVEEAFTIKTSGSCKAPECTCSEGKCQGKGNPFRKESRVFVPKDGPTSDELFVFLGGSGGKCSNHKWIGLMAAATGRRAICLAYVNDPSMYNYCQDALASDPATTCGGEIRRENIYGDNTSDRIKIGPRNSIVGRLRALLTHLSEREPELGFDAYLSDGAIQWQKVAIAGFSQGGGNAGILSQDHEVARAIFYSKGIGSSFHILPETCETLADCPAEAEECQGNMCVRVEPSAYVTEPRATPPERTWGIIHEAEGAVTYSLDAWRQWGMDLCSDVVSIEDYPDDYYCSHMLSTRATPGGSDKHEYHGSMGSDMTMAKDENGYPINQRAYMMMMSAP